MENVNSDIGALQLGARAISMYTEALQLRQEIKDKDAHVTELTTELENETAKGRDYEAELGAKRADVENLATELSQKVKVIMDLEGELQALKKDYTDKSREVEQLCDALEQQRKVNTQESHAHGRVVDELKEELANRDRSINTERAEKMRLQSVNAELEGKYNSALGELRDSQFAMDQMMDRNQQQTELVQSMTEQVQKSETKLHQFKVQE